MSRYHMRRKSSESGGAIVEMALISPFFVTLLTGVFIYGMELIQQLELAQVARDTAALYSSGIDLSSSTNQSIVSRLGTMLNWPATGGLTATSPGVVYASTIMYVDGTCNTGVATVCANNGFWVFVNSVDFGNTGLHTSNYGAPNTCACMDSSGNVKTTPTDNRFKTSTDRNTSFDLLSKPADLGSAGATTQGFQPGNYAYLVEVAAKNFRGTAIYAYALF